MLKKQTKLWRTLMLSTWFTISHHRTAEPPARHSAVKSYQNQGFSQTETHQQLKKPKVTQFTSATPVLNSPFIPSAAVQEALLVHLAGSHKHFLHNAPATFLTMAHISLQINDMHVSAGNPLGRTRCWLKTLMYREHARSYKHTRTQQSKSDL